MEYRLLQKYMDITPQPRPLSTESVTGMEKKRTCLNTSLENSASSQNAALRGGPLGRKDVFQHAVPLWAGSSVQHPASSGFPHIVFPVHGNKRSAGQRCTAPPSVFSPAHLPARTSKRSVFRPDKAEGRPFPTELFRQRLRKNYAFTFMDCTSSSIRSGYSRISLSMMKLRRCWNLFFSVLMKSALFGTVRGLYLS